MIDLTPITAHVAPAGLVLARLTGLFLLAPLVSHPAVPRIARALLAFVMALAIYPVVSGTFVQYHTVVQDWSTGVMIMALASELLIGFVIGLFAIIPFTGVQLAGHAMGQQFGLAIAQSANADLESNSGIVGIVLFYLAVLIFIALGGIEVLFASLLESYRHVPPGGYRATIGLVEIVVGALQTSFELALRVAAPVMCLMFLQTIALGFISRTAPAFNILSLGFPIRVLLGLAVTLGSIFAINETIVDALSDLLDDLMLLFG